MIPPTIEIIISIKHFFILDNRSHTAFNIMNVYKHITYCGSICASALIYYNTFFMQEFDVSLHKKTLGLVFFKSFMLYGSTEIEYIHHGIQFILCCAFYSLLNQPIENTHQLNNAYRLTYYILFTPMFNNIKFYVPKSQVYARVFLDMMTAITFFYYRSQFSIYWMSNEGVQLLFTLFGNNIGQLFVYFGYILTAMNIYWGHIILKIIYRKTRMIIKKD